MSGSDSVVIHMRNEIVHTEFVAHLRCGRNWTVHAKKGCVIVFFKTEDIES